MAVENEEDAQIVQLHKRAPRNGKIKHRDNQGDLQINQ